ncbi:hypothetical protein, partial [Plesiomonas sp.]|uniref:hypothetical protein n=1 Tax=Plesiomonas sp. TaxID=2486279 RepID=UPI003F2F82B7
KAQSDFLDLYFLPYAAVLKNKPTHIRDVYRARNVYSRININGLILSKNINAMTVLFLRRYLIY